MNEKDIKRIILENSNKLPLIFSTDLKFKKADFSDGKIIMSKKSSTKNFSIASFYKSITRFS